MIILLAVVIYIMKICKTSLRHLSFKINIEVSFCSSQDFMNFLFAGL